MADRAAIVTGGSSGIGLAIARSHAGPMSSIHGSALNVTHRQNRGLVKALGLDFDDVPDSAYVP